MANTVLERDKIASIAEDYWRKYGGKHIGYGMHGATSPVDGCRACEQHMARLAVAVLDEIGILKGRNTK